MIRHAIERPVSTLIGAATLVVLGTFSLFRLPVSLLPELERPSLEIRVDTPGRARDEVLDSLTRPLERRLAALAGVTSVRTWTGDGSLRARVDSEWQTDGDRLRIEAERLLSDLEAPATIETATGDPEPIVEVAVLGGPSGAARTAFARKLLVPELARIEGAGRIETVGLTPLHAVIRPQAAALASRGLTTADVVARLQSVGTALPAGRARAGAAVRPLFVREDAASLDDLRAVRLGDAWLGDVARVDLEEMEDGTFFRLNGRPGALVRVFRAPEANAVALAVRLRERVDELAGRSGSAGPAGLIPQVVADRSREVVAALRQLAVAALIGVGLGVLVLRFVLGRWRATLALAAVVPASMLTAFAGFQLGGASLDVISLAGLALAAGMLVDSSIVVLEAIETARAAGDPTPALTGAREIALPVIAGFLATAVVFLPLIYLQGLARAFFGVQAFAIVTSLGAALLFSLTVTPVLSGSSPSSGSGGRSPGRRTYLRLLDFALARPAVVVLAGTAVAALTVVGLLVLPRELVPDAASSELVVRYRLAPDLTPEAARRLGEAVVARASAAAPGASLLAIQVPEDDRGGRETEEEDGRVVLAFDDPGAAARAEDGLRATLSRLPDVEVWVEPHTSAFVEPIERAGRRLEVVATALTPERAAALAGRVRRRLAAAGLREVTARAGRARPALLLTWNPVRLAELGGLDELGTDRGRIEEQVRQGLGEPSAGRVKIDGVEPEVLVRAPDDQDPELLPVGVAPARIVPLGALARLAPGLRPAVLERLDGRSAERLVFEGETGDPSSLLDGLADTAGRADERATPGGQALEMSRAFAQLRLALGLSLILVFLTVAALYESLRLPLVVMATVPVAMGGALGLLALTGQTLNVLSFLGLILLAGIVVNNAIVLVHRIQERLQRGEEMDAAIRAAARERYRPILMTTATTVSGMLPLALLPGEGVELQRALAIGVIGGMVTATFASLLLVPVLYRRARRGM